MAKPNPQHKDFYSSVLNTVSAEIDSLPVRKNLKLKGAHLLLQYMASYGVNSARITTDLDYDYWVGEEVVKDVISHLKTVLPAKYPQLFKAVRSDRSSYGTHGVAFDVLDPDGAVVKIKVDFSRHMVDNVNASLFEMLSDKFEVNTTRTLLRRSKDAFDLYVLTNMIANASTLKYSDFTAYHKSRGRGFDVGSAVYFTSSGVAELTHAMSKYIPNPLPTLSFGAIIASNTKFLSIFMYDLKEQDAKWEGQRGWVKI